MVFLGLWRIFFFRFQFSFKREMHDINSHSHSMVGRIVRVDVMPTISTHSRRNIRVTLISIPFYCVEEHHSLWHFHSGKPLICNDKWSAEYRAGRRRVMRMRERERTKREANKLNAMMVQVVHNLCLRVNSDVAAHEYGYQTNRYQFMKCVVCDVMCRRRGHHRWCVRFGNIVAFHVKYDYNYIFETYIELFFFQLREKKNEVKTLLNLSIFFLFLLIFRTTRQHYCSKNRRWRRKNTFTIHRVSDSLVAIYFHLEIYSFIWQPFRVHSNLIAAILSLHFEYKLIHSNVITD